MNSKIGLTKRTESLDTIQLGVKEVEELLKWGYLNHSLVTNCKFAFEEALINLKNDTGELMYCLHFKLADKDNLIIDNYYFNEQQKKLSLIANVVCEPVLKYNQSKQQFAAKVIDYDNLAEKNKDGRIVETVVIVMSLMAYMENFKTETKYIETKVLGIASKKSKKRQNANKTVKLKKIIVVHVSNNVSAHSNANTFERHTDAWKVRGHWRHYKTGKDCWVKPHTKGSGKVAGKDYTIEISSDN